MHYYHINMIMRTLGTHLIFDYAHILSKRCSPKKYPFPVIGPIVNYLTRMDLSQMVYVRYKIPCFVFINILILRVLGLSANVAVADE